MSEANFLPIFLVVFVLLVSGILGGSVTYLMNSFSKEWNRFEYLKCVLFGIFFSSLILFFIEITTGNLLTNETKSPLNYVVFGCLCFLSSVFLSIIFRKTVSKFPVSRK